MTAGYGASGDRADMRHAIGYALNWPERRHLPVERLNLSKIGQLRFEAPDESGFPRSGWRAR